MTSVNLEPETLSAELRTFAKKLASGKKATTDWETGIELLARLPGWKLQPFVGALELKGNNLEAMSKVKGPLRVPNGSYSDFGINHYGAKGTTAFLASVRGGVADRPYDEKVAIWKERIVVVGKTPPMPAQLGVVYAEKFEVRDVDEGNDYRMRMLDVSKMWYGTRAATVTAPDGASIVIYDEPKAPNEFGSAAFYTWASKHGFTDAVKTIGEAFKPSAEHQDRERLGTLDETGVCAICQRRQKMHHVSVKQPLMYDHGYQIPEEALRQGWAPRVGSCFGVGYPPWEISSLGARQYAAYLQEQVPKLKTVLQQKRAARRIVHTRNESVRENGRRIERVVEDVYTPEHPDWQEVYERAVRAAEGALAMTEQELAFFKAKVAGWARTDTFDEHAAGQRFYTAKEPKAVSSSLLAEAQRRLAAMDDD